MCLGMGEGKWRLKNIISGQIVDITKSVFKVGRNFHAELTATNTSLSRNHATLSILIDGFLYAQDNNSCNGTFINDKKIPAMEIQLLKPGDVIGFGCCERICQDQKFETTPLIFEVLKAEPECEVDDKNDVIKDASHLNKSQKPSENKVEPDVGFSANNADDYIVISDEDDDDNIFTNSQIVQFSEKIKQEQTSLHDSVDPYAHIKHELEDLDFCDSIINIQVDLTSDLDRFNDTTDLLNILDSPARPSQSETPAEVEKAKEEIPNTNSKPESSSNLHKSKYVKPPIVEPHVGAKPTKPEANKKEKQKNDAASASHVENTISSLKRKSSKMSPVPKKKINMANNMAKRTCDKKSINEEFKKRGKANNITSNKKELNRESKEQILAERRRKLKELSDKNNGNGSGDGPEKNFKTVPKVKKSDGRGNFLLNTNTVSTKIKSTNISVHSLPSTSKSSCCIKENCTERKYTDKNSNTKKDYDDKIQDKTVSSNSVSKNEANKIQVVISPKKFLNQQVEVPLKVLTKEFEERTNHFQKPDSTFEEDKTGLIWRNTSNFPRHNNNYNGFNGNFANLDDELAKIIHWSVKWLWEQNNRDISPPVNGDKTLINMPLSFNRFSDYDSAVSPLIMLELWQYIYQTLYDKDEERTPIRAYVRHRRVVGKLTYLDCECYISEQEVIKNNMFRMDDLGMIELRLKDNINTYIYTNFGYIKCCTRIQLRDNPQLNSEFVRLCNGPPHTQLKFTLVTKSLHDKVIIGSQIILKVIGNIASYLRLFKTIKYLEASTISSLVLSPKIENYKVEKDNQDVIVEVKLNDYQKAIVLEACSMCLRNTPGMYLIKGPPGTGKTTVIVNIVLQILLSNPKKYPPILLTAPSNAAVDGLILKLAEARGKLPDHHRKHIKLVRIGPDSSISKNVDKFKLSTLAQNNILTERRLNNIPEYKEVLEKGINLEHYLKKQLKNNYFYDLKHAEDYLLYNCNIICTTLNSCVGSRIMDAFRRGQLKFSCCIIDEATQCNEPESLLPIQLGIDKFVLVGDPKQLPAVVCNKEAQRMGYGKSLFARIDDNFKNTPGSPIKSLIHQYRMKKEICEYPNKQFYGGKLQSFPLHTNKITPALKPYLLFNLMIKDQDDKANYINSQEVSFIVKLLETLKESIHESCKYTIGIITPYRAQKDLLLKNVSGIRFNSNVSITVNTVDSFQGAENDIIIISCVRYAPNYFLQNEQRLNVALTRARQALYVIGNYTLFKHCRLLYDLREDAKNRKVCIDLNENTSQKIRLRQYIIQR